LKSVIVGLAGWARHYREIPSRRKRGYLRRFPERYRKLLPYLTVSRVCFTGDCITRALREVSPELVILDDKLARKLSPAASIVLESRAVKEKHLRVLVTLAGNLANYARTLLKESPGRALERIRALEK